MEKINLLKSLGFSEEFLEHLELYENNSKFSPINKIVPDEIFHIETNDTCELFIKNPLNNDFKILEFK